MSMQDPIADMVIRCKNAMIMNKKEVSMPYSKLKTEIASVLKEEGYVDNFHVENPDSAQAALVIVLKYYEGQSVIQEFKRVSKPSLRKYSAASAIPLVVAGLGINIISTSKGVMSDRLARKQNVGGEILVSVF